MIPHKQLSLADIYDDCQKIFEDEKHEFLKLLERHINLSDYISTSFWYRYNSTIGRNRKYPLTALIWALLIQKILSIPTDRLLLTMLHLSKPLCEFCGFTKIPEASKITRFKQDFIVELQSVFDRLVDVTEPVCKKIDPQKAAETIFDTSGIEAYVTENNPKYANRIIKQLKHFKKTNNTDKSFDPYKAAYGSMPSHSKSNPAIKQMFINGHFCYAYKFGIVTNGLGIIRDISFFDRDYLMAHPDIAIDNKSGSPDEDKSLSDSKAVLPVLNDFFAKHPLIKPKTFIGDAAFDSMDIYYGLIRDLKFNEVYVPLNERRASGKAVCTANNNGVPCCPRDPSLPMKREGNMIHSKNGLTSLKFVCPKMCWKYDKQTKKSKRVCHCGDPCTSSACGRMVYVYPENNLRSFPGVVRGTDKWNDVYKHRSAVERGINHLKDCFCVADRKTQNDKTLHADLLLAGITQLITVIVADAINKRQYIRSLKPLVA